MSLTLERIEELRQWTRDHDCPLGIEVALDYARERAAREACEAAAAERGCGVGLDSEAGEKAVVWLAIDEEYHRHWHDRYNVVADTPTDAYLALLAELQKAER